MQLTQSDVNPIYSLLLKHPIEAFVTREKISEQWRQLSFTVGVYRAHLLFR